MLSSKHNIMKHCILDVEASYRSLFIMQPWACCWMWLQLVWHLLHQFNIAWIWHCLNHNELSHIKISAVETEIPIFYSIPVETWLLQQCHSSGTLSFHYKNNDSWSQQWCSTLMTLYIYLLTVSSHVKLPVHWHCFECWVSFPSVRMWDQSRWHIHLFNHLTDFDL